MSDLPSDPFGARPCWGGHFFNPKMRKTRNSTELTGDINYRKIAVYGSDSDPRAFNFDGEFNVANRGLVEFVEFSNWMWPSCTTCFVPRRST